MFSSAPTTSSNRTARSQRLTQAQIDRLVALGLLAEVDNGGGTTLLWNVPPAQGQEALHELPERMITQ